MKIIEKRYYHIKGTPRADDPNNSDKIDNYIKAEVYYDEGGLSFTGETVHPRAYYMSVHPVCRVSGMESITISVFTDKGRKALIQKVGRQSKKAEEEALTYFNKNVDAYVQQAFPTLELEEE